MRVTPRITPKNQQSVKRKEDEEKSKQTVETESENGGTSLAQSKGLQYVQDLQDGKQPRKPVPTGNSYAYNPQLNNVNVQRTPRAAGTQTRTVVSQGVNRPQSASAQTNSVQAEASSSAKKSSLSGMISPKINIAQVVGDFKNTAHAIGTPDEIYEEVDMYLTLVEKQTKKDGANVKVVQTNLRNAAGLLDQYISETLKKESKVVENWVEAIFLQQVDYKYNTEDINEAFLVQMPEDNKKTEHSEPTENTVTEPAKTTEPEKPKMDAVLKNLFAQARNISKKGNDDLAISTYQKAIERSKEVNDVDSHSKISFEIGKIYDNKDDLNAALENYNTAATIATDDNVKVKAHYAMAQIYDDVNQFKPAIEHYMAAVSFAGETDNFKAQIKSLTKIGNIYADKYDKEAFNVYEDAKVVADESKDCKNKGYVSSTIATAYDKFNRPTDALKYYSDAVKNYTEAGVDEKVAINYKKAGQLMIDYNKGDKGRNLIQKAIAFAKKANNEELVKELKQELAA